MATPPQLRELTVAELARMARLFDSIDDEGGWQPLASRQVRGVRAPRAAVSGQPD